MTLTEERPAAQVARRAMIDSQLRTSGVTDAAVIAAMLSVRREDYVPEAARASAYIDRAIPLADGRALAAPLVHGKMLCEAQLSPADSVLLIGDKDGYLAALLRQLGVTPDALEPSKASRKVSGKGPYSLVIIDGAVEALPDSLASLIEEGGRLVTGLVERGVTRLAVGRKVAGMLSLLPLAEIGIPVLAGFAAPKRWSF